MVIRVKKKKKGDNRKTFTGVDGSQNRLKKQAKNWQNRQGGYPSGVGVKKGKLQGRERKTNLLRDDEPPIIG